MLEQKKSIQIAGAALMNEVESMLRSGHIQAGMDRLILGMKNIKQNYSANDWQTFTKFDCLDRSLTTLIHQCPFTYHSFSKPRGYAGDAELIDYIYTLKLLPDDLTEMGREILNHRIDTSATRSVRARRDILAETIDSIADTANHPS
jgi:extracellular factor (EF) 3-hydroxypalmitic acid methyl ester biosynthesis protein